jgi:hypothetical protein
VIKNTTISIFPALYAWQNYSLGVGIAVYIGMATLLAAISWMFVLRDMNLKWLFGIKVVLIVLTMVVIGLSATEMCRLEKDGTSTCHSAFWPNRPAT